MHVASRGVAVPHDYDDSRQQRHPAAREYPATSTSSQLFSPQATRLDFPQAISNWNSPGIQPPPLITPPFSTRGIEPAAHLPQTPTDSSWSRLLQPQASCQKVFHSYNPKSETRNKDKSRRSCVSCYNRNDRKCSLDQESCDHCTTKSIHCRQSVQTLNLFDSRSVDGVAAAAIRTTKFTHPLLHCRLNITRSESTPAQALSVAQISSCYLDTQSIVKHSDGLSSNLRFDEVLDGNARPVGKSDSPRRNIEEDIVGDLQVHCRRSCSLLYLLAHPETNTVIHDVSRLPDLPGLVCGFLGQLYRKVKTHWEALFDRFRSWLSGRRNKTSFSRQKAAVATALAQLLAHVELYNTALTKWSSMGMPMVSLATSIATLSSYLEFLGKGVESKSFDVERKQTGIITLAVQLSTGSPDAPAESTTKESSFYEVLTQALEEAFPHATGDACISHMVPVARSTADATPLSGVVPIPSALAMSMEPVAPEDAHNFIFNRTPNPDIQSAWEQETTAQRLNLQKQAEEESRSIREIEETLEERKQNLRKILQKIHEMEVSLGLVQAPGPSIFDDNWPLPTPIFEEQSDSPGALTLVDSVLEVALPSPIKEEPPGMFPAPIVDFGLNDAEDVLMKELTTDKLDQSIDQTFDDIRKRKRFSGHISSKKVRTEDNTHRISMTSPPSSGVRHQKNNKPNDIHIFDKTTHGNEVDSGPKFPVTSRPISWPRTSSRLFRYSAGVSVKKLTDVFENLGLKQRQS